MSGKRLRTYRDRRDFSKSPEPDGATRDWKKTGNPVFVIQQHAASTMHWDFRLEIDGALVSWSVPKGPSTDPSEKRLAVHTEDHPLEYAGFEGRIPEDQYGGGQVIVWDAGPYRNLRDVSLPRSLEEGQIEVWLEGRKLRGGYAVIHAEVGGDVDNWLLVKMDDEGADARRNPVSTEPRSVLTERTVEEVEGEPDG